MRNLDILIIFVGLFAVGTCTNCEWVDPSSGDRYVFNALAKDVPWKLTDKSLAGQANLFNIIYLFNFCGPMRGATCNNRNNIAIYETLEVLGQPTDACEVVGQADKMTVTKGTTQGKDGVKIVFQGGDTCLGSENPTQNGQPKQATFNIVCSSKTDANFVQLDPNSLSITKCSPEFVIHSPAGCVGGSYSSSFFILKWIIIIGAIYFIAGTVFNIRKNGLSGAEAVPHIEVIRELPTHARNLTDSIRSKLKERFNSDSSSSSNGGFTSSASRTAQYTVV